MSSPLDMLIKNTKELLRSQFYLYVDYLGKNSELSRAFFLGDHYNKNGADYEKTKWQKKPPGAEDEHPEAKIEEALRKTLARAVVFVLFKPSDIDLASSRKSGRRYRSAESQDILDRLKEHIKIGRIIVHGLIPDILWSHRECWRPVDFYLSDTNLSEKCTDRCHMKCGNGKKVECKDTDCYGAWKETIKKPDHHILDFLPPRWRRKVEETFPVGSPKPQCWPAVFFLQMNLGTPPCRVWSQFGRWTLHDVFILARQRFERFSVYKTDMLKTQSQAPPEKVAKLKLFSDEFSFKAEDFIEVSRNYLSKPDDNSDLDSLYRQSFGGKIWRSAKRLRFQYKPKEGITDPDTRKMRNYSEEIAHCFAAQERDDGELQGYRRLDRDRCVLFSELGERAEKGWKSAPLEASVGVSGVAVVRG